jgi:1-carboxybiuret hydrolase subunit AtzG-like protein
MKEPDFGALLDAMSVAIDLPIPEASRAAVAANLARLHALAAEVVAFGIPPDRHDPDGPPADDPS